MPQRSFEKRSKSLSRRVVKRGSRFAYGKRNRGSRPVSGKRNRGSRPAYGKRNRVSRPACVFRAQPVVPAVTLDDLKYYFNDIVYPVKYALITSPDVVKILNNKDDPIDITFQRTLDGELMGIASYGPNDHLVYDVDDQIWRFTGTGIGPTHR